MTAADGSWIHRTPDARRRRSESGWAWTPATALEALYAPLKSIRKWTSGSKGPDFAFQVTTITISAVTAAPLESVADTHTS